MEKKYLIGFLAVATLVIAGCSQGVQESPQLKVQRNSGPTIRETLERIESADVVEDWSYNCSGICDSHYDQVCVDAHVWNNSLDFGQVWEWSPVNCEYTEMDGYHLVTNHFMCECADATP